MEKATQYKKLNEIKDKHEYFVDVSGKLDGFTLDNFNYDVGIGKEENIGLYNTINGVISFVDKDRHVYAGFKTKESEEALKNAGFVKGDINMPFSNDGGLKLEKLIMGLNHDSEAESTESSSSAYEITDNNSIKDCEKNLQIHYLEKGKAKKTNLNEYTNLYDILEKQKEGQISHIRLDAKNQGIVEKLVEKYLDLAFNEIPSNIHHNYRVNCFKKALAGMYLTGLTDDKGVVEKIDNGLNPSYHLINNNMTIAGDLSKELDNFYNDFGFGGNKENFPERIKNSKKGLEKLV
ncbi:MAG: hypothetical protein PHV16_02840 [Candidatus Nanoarchaeia archaeon]|nr:hypothetical protein [Candidatus Nanoarchaeia archaeon]